MLLGGTLAASILAFQSAQIPMLFIVTPFVLWASLRFEVIGACAAGILVSAVALWATVSQAPGMHWLGGELRTQIQAVQLYLTVLVVPALLIAVVLLERRRAEAQTRKLANALEQAADAVMITDSAGVIEYVNPAFETMTGFTRADAAGATPRILRSGLQDRTVYAQLWSTLRDGRVWSDVLINRKKDGSVYYEEQTISPVQDEQGRISHFVATGKDITERIQIQERLRFLAYHDALTGLPNRALFMEMLHHGVARAQRTDSAMAVLFVDLDGFKQVNDALGHEAGDRLLGELAARLRDRIREEDTVARLGGDEFTILIEEVSGPDAVSEVARKLLAALQEPLELEGQGFSLTASIGISLFPADGGDPSTLVRHADTAMYRAKEAGRNRFQFYSEDMGERVSHRLFLVVELRKALEQEQLVLHYQPQVELSTGQVTRVEALLRWEHPQRGLVPPSEFIPVMEETGLIHEAGAWVLRTACAQTRLWSQAGHGPLRVSVNLSSVQLEDPALPEQLRRAMEDSGLEPGRLECEITETTVMRNPPLSNQILQRLRALGIAIAVDDFGTGYSSLAYLKRFPVHAIKIDRAFVRDLPDDPEDAAIVAAVLALGQSLGLRVVAEGVETRAQLEFLEAGGCSAVQGFLLGRPVPAAELPALIARIHADVGSLPSSATPESLSR